jgi:hypothetical protein
MKQVKEAHPGLTSNKAIKSITRDTFVEMFEGLAHLIVKKIKWMRRRDDLVVAHAALLRRFKESTCDTERFALLQELEKHEAAFEEAERPIAFYDMGPVEQDRAFSAAQYNDEWVYNPRTKSGLRAWCICQAGHAGWECNTLMCSRHWRRRWEDPGTTLAGQRWYCVIHGCHARYKTRFGMLVQVLTQNLSTFMLAPCSDKDVEDIRAMALEERYQPKDALDLWRQIPDFIPEVHDHQILRPAMPEECEPGTDCTKVFRIRKDAMHILQTLPRWEWNSIFSFVKQG